MDEAPGGLDEARKCEEEADEEGYVLDGHGCGASVTVDQLALENVGIVGDPRSDQRA